MQNKLYMKQAESNQVLKDWNCPLILFQTQVELKFSTKLDYIFKFGSFFCLTSSNLLTNYLTNVFFFHISTKFCNPFTNLC